MSATSAPYGLIPVMDVGGSVRGANQRIQLTANSANAFFKGGILNFASGVATPVTATPTTTLGANTPWGVIVGVEYTDSFGPQFKSWLPANGYTSFSGYGPIYIHVVSDPDVIMKVQASAAITYSELGLNASLLNFGGSTTTGVATIQVNGTPATTNTLAVKVIDIALDTNNAAGDAYTDVYVIWNQNVHAKRNILGQ